MTLLNNLCLSKFTNNYNHLLKKTITKQRKHLFNIKDYLCFDDMAIW